MCAISCRTNAAASSRLAWVGGVRQSKLSVQVTQPQFSIAPPKSGTKTRS